MLFIVVPDIHWISSANNKSPLVRAALCIKTWNSDRDRDKDRDTDTDTDRRVRKEHTYSCTRPNKEKKKPPPPRRKIISLLPFPFLTPHFHIEFSIFILYCAMPAHVPS